MKKLNIATKLIHAGIEPDPTTGAIMTPIYQTSTYVQQAPGVHKGYEYARTDNPTRTVLQNNLAQLEEGKYALCFASGLAATDAVIKLLNPNDEVIVSNDLYGGTYRIFVRVFQKYGIKFHFVDMSNLQNITNHLNKNTRLIWLETPTNPMLNVYNIQQIALIAQKHNVLLAVDNTFATPCIQTPLTLGADLVIHSVTKYLSGHSDTIMGAVICNKTEIYDQLKFLQNATGAVPAPMDCFLVLRGIKTLHLRMQQHCKNALKIAEYLKKHPKVATVNYPAFEDHPHHLIAQQQMCDFGGMVSFTLKNDSIQAATKVLSGTHLFSLAESLGGVESLIGHPATMTHASIPLAERQKTGVLDSLIRLSVGIEYANDLIDDLAQALEKV